MKEEIARSLKEAVENYLVFLNNPQIRASYNKYPETFSLVEITPLSDHSASVVFMKENSRKKMIAFFFLLPSSGKWRQFVPTDAHIAGFGIFGLKKADVEKENFAISIAPREIDPDQKRFLEEMRKKAKEEITEEADDEVPF